MTVDLLTEMNYIFEHKMFTGRLWTLSEESWKSQKPIDSLDDKNEYRFLFIDL